jgi:putative ABC transport system substrate-binding protein
VSHLPRRQFLLATGALLTRPLCTFAQQQSKVWRVGILSPRARRASTESEPYEEFQKGMRDLGYVEGKNVQYEWRYADGMYERLPDLAASLVKLKIDVILAATTPAALAAQRATKVIPIVIVAVGDPVGSGLVASLAQPGGNITGITNLTGDASQKQLSLLVAALPKLSRVGVLSNPDNQSSEGAYKSVQTASKTLRVIVFRVQARTPAEIAQAFSAMARERADACYVIGDSFFFNQREQLAKLAAKAGLPAIYAQRQHVEAGGLMSYGANPVGLYRRAATYVDKILKGARPADLPVEQANVLELVLNRKAATALGIVFPQELVLRADEVID